MSVTALALSKLASPQLGILRDLVRQGTEGEHEEEGPISIHVSLAPEELFHIGPIGVTNSMLMTALVVLGLSLVAFWMSRGMKLIPTGKQNFLESIIEALLNLVEGTAGRRVGRIILPLIGTFFIYILVANWLSLVPGVGTILWHSEEHGDVPLLRAPNADYNMTLAMAVLTIVIVQVAGFASHGFLGHLKEYINPLHIIEEFARVASLSIRLFANIFAGEVLIAVMVALSLAVAISVVSIILPITFLALEFFFGLIQALLFSLLSLIYIALAVGEHPEHGAHDEQEAWTGEEATAH